MESPQTSGRSRPNTTLEERAEYVRLQEESGKSVAEFCRDLGLAESTFGVWRRQVKEPMPSGVTITDVPAAMVEAAMPVPSRASVTMRLPSGAVLEIVAGTDPLWLAQLVTTVSR